MRAGLLRHLVTIQTRPSTAQNEYGAPSGSTSWHDDTEINAGIWPLKGSEYHLANQGQSQVTHKIQMRWMPLANGSKISPKCRIKWHDPELEIDRHFEIVSVINTDEKNHSVQLMCIEKT